MWMWDVDVGMVCARKRLVLWVARERGCGCLCSVGGRASELIPPPRSPLEPRFLPAQTIYGSGPDFLNGENWSAGYTGTLLEHGTEVDVSTMQPADLVFYRYPARRTHHRATAHTGGGPGAAFCRRCWGGGGRVGVGRSDTTCAPRPCALLVFVVATPLLRCVHACAHASRVLWCLEQQPGARGHLHRCVAGAGAVCRVAKCFLATCFVGSFSVVAARPRPALVCACMARPWHLQAVARWSAMGRTPCPFSPSTTGPCRRSGRTCRHATQSACVAWRLVARALPGSVMSAPHRGLLE
jgi:hypothetical protein